MTEHNIVIGSRGSRLAVIQSEMVRDFIREKKPGCQVEILTMKTTGDKILDRTLEKIGGKGLFVKELDKALLGWMQRSFRTQSERYADGTFRRAAAACIFQKRGSKRCVGASGRSRKMGQNASGRMFQPETDAAA